MSEHRSAFQEALAQSMDQMREAYKNELESYIGSPLFNILHYKNGWPIRFHPFPRLDRARWLWRDVTRARIPLAVEVMRGRHECL